MSIRNRIAAIRPGVSPLGVLLPVFLLIALAYSIAIPLFEGPDEDDHFRYARFIANNHALPVQLFQAGGGEAGHQGWQPPLYYILAALVISPIDTSDFEQHLWRNPGTSFQGDRACCGRNLYFHTRSEDLPYTHTTLAVHLARLVTILFGAVTVATIYYLMLTLMPAARGLAFAAAGVVAFNPGFLFASALVSNDVPLAALCSLALLLCARLLNRSLPPSLKAWAVLGLVIGLAIMVKTTALALIPVAAAVAVWLALSPGSVSASRYKVLVNALIGTMAPLLLFTGWWFVRNQVLYGDPLAARLVYVSAIFPRESPLTWEELFQINLPWLWQTFWGGPTPGDLAPAFPAVLLGLSALSAAGAVWFFLSERDRDTRAVLVLLGGWLALIFAAQIEFIRTSGGTDQGRYLYPAIASFAVLGALGIAYLVSRAVNSFRRSTPSARQWGAQLGAPILSILCAMTFLAFALFVLFAYTIPAYARPPQLSERILSHADQRLDANFSNIMALRGYSISTRSLRPGDEVNVTLYWQSLNATKVSYRVFVHLVGEKNRVAGGKDVVPAQGAYATVLWQPGDWVQDSITFNTSPDAVPGVYQVEIGLYPYGQPGDRLNLAGSDQDHVLVDAVKVQG